MLIYIINHASLIFIRITSSKRIKVIRLELYTSLLGFHVPFLFFPLLDLASFPLWHVHVSLLHVLELSLPQVLLFANLLEKLNIFAWYCLFIGKVLHGQNGNYTNLRRVKQSFSNLSILEYTLAYLEATHPFSSYLDPKLGGSILSPK